MNRAAGWSCACALVSLAIACGGTGSSPGVESGRDRHRRARRLGCAVFSGERLVRVSTRPSVTLSFAYAAPAQPLATVILSAGSDGLLKLSKDGIGASADNFVVRTRQQYFAAGFATALVDVPSDHSSGLGNAYRTGSAEADDIAPVIAWLRARSPAPLWLVGTSRDTISAANVGARLGHDGPDGLILTSSITTGPNATLYEVALKVITVPTLFVHHKEDACPASPFAGVAALRAAFTGAY